MPNEKRRNQHRIDAATVEVLAAWRAVKDNPGSREAQLALRFCLAELEKNINYAPELLSEVERAAPDYQAIIEKAEAVFEARGPMNYIDRADLLKKQRPGLKDNA